MTGGDSAKERRQIVIVGIVTALTLFGDSMLYIVLPVYWKEAGLDALWQVGVLLSVNRLVRLPLNPLIGWLYHRMSLRTGLFMSVGLAALTTVGYGIFKGFVLWVALRAIWGIAWSLLRMGGYLTVIRYSDDTNRGRFMGTYNGLWRLGSLVGVLFGGLLVPMIGLSAVSILFGIMALIGLPLIAVSISKGKASGMHQLDPPRGVRNTVWSLQVKKIVISGLMISLLHAVFGATLTYLIDTSHPGGIPWFGLIIGSTALGGVLTALRCAWEPFLARWFGRHTDGPRGRLPLFMVSLAGAAAGYALLPWQLPIGIWVGIVIFVMITSTALGTIMDAMASDAAKNTSVITVMTAYSVSTDLGAAIGPTLIYWVVGLQYGMTSMYLACAAVFILIGLWYRQDGMRKGRGFLGEEANIS
ncbi:MULTISPECIES: MFS transporter [Paenibacillus]|uniref:MFS family permease n=1 Tax=Paenibacillus lactis TaxID=228574 RepID=A0ABS4FCE7_9BACL|nr:MFS transporter [Paenibacillus lactis]MBP1893929.1 MFS family permease [Paenibacillus lactis]MCM3492467.1 MFS transporter [Paenibacillus lactis]GIO90052.1 MFS transporter [Paenibacillus lactis]